MLERNAKVNTNYVISSCWRLTFYLFLEKVLIFLIKTWTQPLSPGGRCTWIESIIVIMSLQVTVASELPVYVGSYQSHM